MYKRTYFLIVLTLLLVVVTGCSEKKTTQADIVIEATAEVALDIKLPDGTPLYGTNIWLMNNSTAKYFSKMNAECHHHFPVVPYGTYTLTVSKAGHKDFSIDNFVINEQIVQLTVYHHPKNFVYLVGDIGLAGGIVFYDKGSFTNGWRYLEVAPGDQEYIAEWGAKGHLVDTSENIGSGYQNTMNLISKLTELGEVNKAVQLSREIVVNGYADWFIPSIYELSQLMTHRDIIGGFNQNYYWSSSGYHHGFANEHAALWDYDWNRRRDFGRDEAYGVRVVRRF